MVVRVLLFARLRERLKASHLDLELADGTSVGELLQLIATRHPEVAPLCRASRVSVNQIFAGQDARLHADDELALIPPVSGGA